MTNDKSPLKGMTINEFRQLRTDIITILGRVFATTINAELKKMADIPKLKLKPSDYCPGCGEISSRAPDLCPECLALNADE